jgi:hypothetical protein
MDGTKIFFSCFSEIMFRRIRCHRPQRKPDSIEYHVSLSQLSFLITPPLSTKPAAISSNESGSFSSPALFTFPTNATLRLILSQRDFLISAAKHAVPSMTTIDISDAHFELESKTLDDNLQFSSIILTKALILVINGNISLKFHESRRLMPNAAELNEHRKRLFHRLPIENGHRPKSDERHLYPNESLDLLFDTLHGELSYLTEYLKSHLGERHKFTVYPIQERKQYDDDTQWYEWDTGIYKMRGDRDGTVNIALASDWYVCIILIV